MRSEWDFHCFGYIKIRSEVTCPETNILKFPSLKYVRPDANSVIQIMDQGETEEHMFLASCLEDNNTDKQNESIADFGLK